MEWKILHVVFAWAKKSQVTNLKDFGSREIHHAAIYCKIRIWVLFEGFDARKLSGRLPILYSQNKPTKQMKLELWGLNLKILRE